MEISRKITPLLKMCSGALAPLRPSLATPGSPRLIYGSEAKLFLGEFQVWRLSHNKTGPLSCVNGPSKDSNHQLRLENNNSAVKQTVSAPSMNHPSVQTADQRLSDTPMKAVQPSQACTRVWKSGLTISGWVDLDPDVFFWALATSQ